MKTFHFRSLFVASVLAFGVLGLRAAGASPIQTILQDHESYATHLTAATQTKAPFSVKSNLARTSTSLYYYTGYVYYNEGCLDRGNGIPAEGVYVYVGPLCTSSVPCYNMNPWEAQVSSSGFFAVEIDEGDLPSGATLISNGVFLDGWGTDFPFNDDLVMNTSKFENEDFGAISNCTIE